MRRTAVLLAACLLVIVSVGAVLAYGTVAGLGQNREHERITRHGLGCAIALGLTNCFQPESISALAGDRGTFGGVGAPDNPIRGLLSNSAAHCDNGDYLPIPGYANTLIGAQTTLESCRAWMETHLNAAVAAARALVLPDGTIDDSQIPTLIGCTFLGSPGRAKCNVLEELGLVLHASEDFYSHTNWTDFHDILAPVGPRNPPGLGNAAPSPWLDLRNASPAFPAGLISGCFEGFPEFFFCNAGPGGRVKHEFLNKDKGTIDPAIGGPATPRGLVQDNFRRSVQVAILDTRDKWSILQERLVARWGARDGNLMICAITHDDPSATCGGNAQRSSTLLSLFSYAGLFVATVALFGGGAYLSRRRPRQAA